MGLLIRLSLLLSPGIWVTRTQTQFYQRAARDIVHIDGFYIGIMEPIGQRVFLGKVWGRGLSQNVVWYVVRTCCEKAGLEHIAPHDLRRTCAKLCHDRGGELEQIQFLLGHASVQTTERYLGCKQNLGHPVNDLFDLRTDGQQQEKRLESAAVESSAVKLVAAP